MAEYYRIKGETLTAIADVTRKMAGKNVLFTTDEIIYWLNRVQFIPAGNAESIQSIVSQISTAIGNVPTVYRGMAMSSQSITNISNAVGSLVESTE